MMKYNMMCNNIMCSTYVPTYHTHVIPWWRYRFRIGKTLPRGPSVLCQWFKTSSVCSSSIMPWCSQAFNIFNGIALFVLSLLSGRSTGPKSIFVWAGIGSSPYPHSKGVNRSVVGMSIAFVPVSEMFQSPDIHTMAIKRRQQSRFSLVSHSSQFCIDFRFLDFSDRRSVVKVN